MKKRGFDFSRPSHAKYWPRRSFKKIQESIAHRDRLEKLLPLAKARRHDALMLRNALERQFNSADYRFDHLNGDLGLLKEELGRIRREVTVWRKQIARRAANAVDKEPSDA